MSCPSLAPFQPFMRPHPDSMKIHTNTVSSIFSQFVFLTSPSRSYLTSFSPTITSTPNTSQPIITMYPSFTLPTLLLLVAHLSTALPSPESSPLPRPADDGAKNGCHPVDFQNACVLNKAAEGNPASFQYSVDTIKTACQNMCWPALQGDLPTSWYPRPCTVSFSSPLLVHVKVIAYLRWLGH